MSLWHELSPRYENPAGSIVLYCTKCEKEVETGMAVRLVKIEPEKKTVRLEVDAVCVECNMILRERPTVVGFS